MIVKTLNNKQELADYATYSQKASIRLTFTGMPESDKHHNLYLLKMKWAKGERPFQLTEAMVDILWNHFNKDT